MSGSLESGAKPVQRVNRQVLLKSRPEGIPEARHFEIVESPMPVLSDGRVLVRNIYLTAEPAMRGWVNAAANYAEPVPVGAVMRGPAVARVEASLDAGFRAGDFVTGAFGWQDYAVVAPQAIQRKLTDTGLPLSAHLGVLEIGRAHV